MSSSDRAVDLEDVIGILDHFSEENTGDPAPTRSGDSEGPTTTPAKPTGAKERSETQARTPRSTATSPRADVVTDEPVDEFEGLLDDTEEPSLEASDLGLTRHDDVSDHVAIPADARPTDDVHEPVTVGEPPPGDPTFFTPQVPRADVPPARAPERPAGIKRLTFAQPRENASACDRPKTASASPGRLRGGSRAAVLAVAAVACFAAGAQSGQRDRALEPPAAERHAAPPAHPAAAPSAAAASKRASAPDRPTARRRAARLASTHANPDPQAPPSGPLAHRPTTPPVVPGPQGDQYPPPVLGRTAPPARVASPRRTSPRRATELPARRRGGSTESPAVTEFSAEFGP